MSASSPFQYQTEATNANSKVAFPVRVLLGRLGGSSPWAGYLPDVLRPAGVPAKVFKTAASSTEPHVEEKVDSPPAYKPQGIPVLGSVWELSQNPAGCREVQHAIDIAPDDEARLAIAEELYGHEWEAMRCPHANHVLQKCIEKLRPESVQFIVDALRVDDLPSQAARHKFACRIVQRLLEHCPNEQVSDIIQTIIDEASHIACHPYGNYVVQHILKHGNDKQRGILASNVIEGIRDLCSDPYGCAVVCCVMSTASHELRAALAERLVGKPHLLVQLACSRHGHPAAKEVMEVLDDDRRKEAQAILAAEEGTLLASRYGRSALGIKGRGAARRSLNLV
eukprot:gb/GFBE01034286.1/.p1 GENE.gb/GFBE01034286.1/~~gb/GFBE01034286.1/.p1  ORF type:complete len:338 (+),score=63.10 gb/GFBE01034286.1/:1-1014(+)